MPNCCAFCFTANSTVRRDLTKASLINASLQKENIELQEKQLSLLEKKAAAEEEAKLVEEQNQLLKKLQKLRNKSIGWAEDYSSLTH